MHRRARPSRRSRAFLDLLFPERLELRRLPASITVAPIKVAEPTSTEATFTATLSTPSDAPVTLAFATANGSAKAGKDYVATKSSVTIPAGSTSATFSVPLIASDLAGKANETFSVSLKAGAGYSVAKRATATIVDANPEPTVSLTGTVVPEGPLGRTTKGYVEVTLSEPSASAVRVGYQTLDGTATSSGKGREYQAGRGTVTIKAGATTAMIPVTVDDKANGGDLVFDVATTKITGATPATTTIGESPARVVIRDDLTAGLTRPVLSVSNPTAVEGDAEVFDVTLSSPSTKPVSVEYQTVANSATTAQFTTVDNVLTIPAGQTTATIAVPTTAGTAFTGSQSFLLQLSDPANATIPVASATATIEDTLPLPSLSVAAATSTATGPGGVQDFTVSLSSAYVLPVSVSYATADGTAVAGTDYTATGGTLTFEPGQTSLTVPVTLLPDMNAAASSSFSLDLSGATDATIASASAAATITPFGTGGATGTGGPGGPTTAASALTVGGGSVVVGTTGTAVLPFTVTLSAASTTAVTVDYATADDSAVAGADYTATGGTLIFAPGVTTQTVDVTVDGESTTSTVKTLDLNLTNASGASITSNSATGTITYATSEPTLAVTPASASIGTTGTASLVFTVSLSGVSASTITVPYSTADGTAVAGTDYTATGGTLTFAPGVTTQTVTVPVLAETTTSTSKTLSLDVTSSSGTTNASANGLATINYEVAGAPSVLSDNLTETSGGTEAVTGTTVAAASFTTDGSAYDLTDVQLLLMASNTTSRATVSLDTDAGLRPGTLVGTLTSPASDTTEALSDTTFTSTGISLAANTTYWVVLSAPSGTIDWSFAGDDTGTGIGFTDTWAESTDSGSTYFAYDSLPTQMKVDATVA